MVQHTFKNLNNCLNNYIYSYLETSGGQSSNQYLSVVPFLTPGVSHLIHDFKFCAKLQHNLLKEINYALSNSIPL
jgi:hypothetical protein